MHHYAVDSYIILVTANLYIALSRNFLRGAPNLTKQLFGGKTEKQKGPTSHVTGRMAVCNGKKDSSAD